MDIHIEDIIKNCYDKDIAKCCGNSLIKEMRDSRTGNLDPNSSKAKGDMFETITCEVRGVKNLNTENDNLFFNRKGQHGKEFDNVIIYCVSKDRKNRKSIYHSYKRNRNKTQYIYI